MERYAKLNAKVIINADDTILNSARYNHEVIRFSLKDRNVDYFGENITTSDKGMEFDILCQDGTYHAKTNLFGDYNAYNVLAAFAAGRWAGISPEEVIRLIAEYKPEGMRQNMLDIGGHKMLVDCFNAEPKTVLGSAETLSQIKLQGTGRKVFITGHIDKLGVNSVEMHKTLADDMEKLDIDIMCFFAGDSKYTYEKLKEKGLKNIYYFDERSKLDDWIRENISTDDVVFYKSGQFKAALAKTIDNVYGTRFQNEQQGNEGTIESGVDFTFKLRQDNIVEVAGYKGFHKNMEIPDRYGEGKVIRTAIGAFRRDTAIKSVKMPDTIVNIGQESFYSCTGLKEIAFSSNLKYIHRSAFNCCKNLRKVDLPYGMLHIEMRAFKDCSRLSEIFIPRTVGFIGEEAFYGCDNLLVLCEKDSYAEKYAQENNIKYKIISM